MRLVQVPETVIIYQSLVVTCIGETRFIQVNRAVLQPPAIDAVVQAFQE